MTDCGDKSNAFTIRLKTAAFGVPYLVIKDYVDSLLITIKDIP